MATVIVPAHNEETVIENCLNSILNQKEVDHIIVACNGCTDSTAALVREKFPTVHCLDIKTPSKVNALNEAERFAAELGTTFPIFYLDADTQISADCIPTVNRYLETHDTLLAAPTPIIDTSHSSWLVRTYYRVWTDLPYIKEGVIATCSYIITEEGRKRFDVFPEVINDDGFIRCNFWNKEISNVPGAEIYIRAPKDIYSLIKIKTRARLGNMQLLATDQAKIKEAKNYGSVMKKKLLSSAFFDTIIYIGIASLIRLRSKKQFKQLKNYRWEKDLSSRDA
ncbi:glycosyltransferase [Leucothrix sargassi]|nr:glycosyltransferase [Leucothrix sargassi]